MINKKTTALIMPIVFLAGCSAEPTTASSGQASLTSLETTVLSNAKVSASSSTKGSTSSLLPHSSQPSSKTSISTKTAEERVIEYIGKRGGSFLVASTIAEQTIQIDSRLDNRLNISGSGSQSNRVSPSSSVSIEYTFNWNLRSGFYTCSRHYYSSNWQTNQTVDETTNVTAYIQYEIGKSVTVQRYSLTGTPKWENTVKATMDSIARDCAKEISYIA